MTMSKTDKEKRDSILDKLHTMLDAIPSKDEQIKVEEVVSSPVPPPVLSPPLPPPIIPKVVDPNAIEEIIIPKRIKILIPVLLMCLGAIIFYFSSYFYYFFIMFLDISIQLFQQGDNGLGAVVLVVQIVAWLVAFFVFYVSFFNIVFPRIRGVNAMRTHNTYARKVFRVIGPNPAFVYLKVKFKLFPFFDWYTMKIPKGLKWVRMPSSIDMHSDNIDLNWERGMYVISAKPLNRIPDDIKTYQTKSQKSLRLLGEEVGLSISGDSDMMKDYYSLNLVLDEDKEPVPKKTLRRPPSELEKEVDDDK